MDWNYQQHPLFTEKTNQITECLKKHHVPDADAEIVADSLVTADYFGVETHGTVMLESHLYRIDAGKYNLKPNCCVVRENVSFAVIDSDNAIGAVAAHHCMNYAIEKAKTTGIYTVLSNNNNTFGPAFYYPLLAAKQGMIGFIASNSPAQMAPIGGCEKMLGTNPLAAVIPVPGYNPIIIDMATSVVAKSKFKEYAAKGLPLPEGWALDINGDPTTDPQLGIEGLILPMAGFKGYGLTLLIDILAGVLSGASFLNQVGRFYDAEKDCMDVGYFMTVVDPIQVFGVEYQTQMSQYVKLIRESKSQPGSHIVLPGDDRIAHLEAMLQQ